MADGQELDNLLIKVDSELGDLKGIESAISALERLSQINKDSSKMVSQLGKLGTELHKFDNLKLDGLNGAVQGIHGMVTALQRLTTVTGSATKAINQLGHLGNTLKTSFDGIGKSLDGIDKVSIGVMNLVGALDRLTQISGSAKNATNQLGNMGDALQHFNGLDKEIEKLVDPISKLMNALGNLGNNNRISIRIDPNGIANVRQVTQHTKKAMSSWNDFRDALDKDKSSLDLGSIFDLTQPVTTMQSNLKIAERNIHSFENALRTSADKIHGYESMFSFADLQNDRGYRNAVRANEMAEAYINAYKASVPMLESAIENANTKAITDAWNHTMQSIKDDVARFDLGELIRTDLPIDQVRANLRQLQNELSKAESSASRAFTELRKLRSLESDEQVLKGQSAYRTASYTYATQIQYARQYRDAIVQLNNALQEQERIAQSDIALLRELPQLQQQLSRYQGTLDKLLANDDGTRESQETILAFEKGIDYLEDRIREINDTLEHIPQTTEGILETMRQIADEAERTERATEKMNQNMRDSIGKGFGAFGSMLSGSKNPILGSLGNLSSLFGKEVANGTAKFSGEMLQKLQGVAGALGKVATGMSQVVAVASVYIAVFRSFLGIATKVRNAIEKFTQAQIQFAKNMLNHVVGAFNAVAGAVNKVASTVRSGAEVITSALRKIVNVGVNVMSVFARFGSVVPLMFKGAKAIGNLITPKAIRNLASYRGSLKDIIKNVRILNSLIKVASKWFTMLTRMLMRKIVQAFISQMKDAFDQIVLWEMKANDGMLQLEHNVSKMYSGVLRVVYQLVAVFEPLINAITTPVESFLDGLASMGENLAKFMAILTGQPYYLRVKKFYKSYGEQVEETNKKVKNLTNGLDELNILNDSSSSDDGGWNIGDYIEKVPVNGDIDLGLPSLKEILDAIKDWLRNIPWDKIKEKVRAFIHRLMEIVNEILKDLDLWGLLGDTLGELFNTLMEAWNQFITDFDPVALEKALSALIVHALEKIDWDLIHENVELTAKKFAQFWNEVFADDKLWDSITKTITNFLNEIVHYFDTWAWTFNFEGMARQLTRSITKILKNFDYEQLRHAVEGWVTGIVDFINKVVSDKEFWKTLGDSIAKSINSTIIEALKDLTGLDFAEMSDSIKLAITNAIDGIKWEDLKASIETLAENITKGINDFFGDEEFLSKVTVALANLGNTILSAIKKSLDTLESKDIGDAIGTAIMNGLATIEWDKVFSLPTDAINALTKAIRGLLDAIPEDFNLGTWLAEHLKITLDDIDWETIHQNVEDFASKVTEYINGLLADKEFWSKLGGFAGETLNVVWDLTIKPLANINLNDLVDSIKKAIKSAMDKINLKDKMGDLGGLTQKIIDAVDYALTTTDWKAIGRQIGDGISAFLDKINPESIAKTIFDAFVALSDTIGGILEKMLANADFYKIGQIIANAFYGILGGLAYFLDTNSAKFSQAIDQFAKGVTDFLDKHEAEIVMFLNKIIDAIGKILSSKSKARHELVERLANILKQTNLGDLLGIIIAGAIRKWVDNMKINVAMFQGVIQSLWGLVTKVASALWDAIKPYLFNIILSVATKWVTQKLAGLITTAILSAFGVAGLPAIIIGAIVSAIAGVIGSLTGWSIADKLKELFAEWLGKNTDKTAEETTEDYKQHWWEFWKKEAPQDVTYEPTVTIDPVVDDSNLEGINWDDYFQDRQNQVIIDDPKFGTITASKIESEEFAGKILNVDEINAQVLNLGDIFADKLKVKEIETIGKDEVNNPMDKLYAGAPNNAEGGVLGARREGGLDTITTKFLEVTEKTTTPILEVAEKITAPVLEITEKITSKLLEISEKITTPLLEAEKIFTQLLETLKISTPLLEAQKLVTATLDIADVKANSLNVNIINANKLNVADIFANTLKVGTIEGQLSGGTSGGISGGISGGTGTSIYDWMFGDGSTIEKPTFATDRWSDMSGLVPHAEDFLDDLSDTYGSVLDDAQNTLSGYTDSYTMPKLYADNESNAETGILADPKAMEEAKKAIGHSGASEDGGLYEWAQSNENVSDDVKDLSTRMINAFQQMADGSFNNGNYTLEDVQKGDMLSWFLLDAENQRTSGKATDEEVANRYKEAEDWLNSFGEEGKEGEEEEKQDKKAIKNVDEFNVLGDETSGSKNPLSWLEDLPLMTEYIMAQVYDIIDKWLGRIWRLLKSFKVPQSFLDLFKDMGFDELDGEIEIPILEEIARKLDMLNGYLALLIPLLKELKLAIEKLEDAIRLLSNNTVALKNSIDNLIAKLDELKGTIADASETTISSTETWAESAENLVDAINRWIECVSDTGHLDKNTEAKSANTKAVEGLNNSLDKFINTFNDAISSISTTTTVWSDSSDDVINAIHDLGDKLGNVKCECKCECNCNCEGCKSGKGSGGKDGHSGGGEGGGYTDPYDHDDYDGGYGEDTHTHENEPYYAGEDVPYSTGDITNPSNDREDGGTNLPTVDEALERGLDLGQVANPEDTDNGELMKYEGLVHNVDMKTGDWTLKDAYGNIVDSGNIYDKEEQEKNGIGKATYDPSTGKTTLYDKDGNVKGEYDSATGKWSGDNAYTRAQEKAEEKKKAWEEKVSQNREQREQKQKENAEKYRKQKEENDKAVEDLVKKAKEYRDAIAKNPNATETQLEKAQLYYNNIATKLSTLNEYTGEYESHYRNLSEVQGFFNSLEKIKNNVDSSDKISKTAPSSYAKKTFDTATGRMVYYDSDGNIIAMVQQDGTWGGVTYKNGEPVNQSNANQSLKDIDAKLANLNIGDRAWEFNNGLRMQHSDPSTAIENQAERAKLANKASQYGGFYAEFNDADAKQAGFGSRLQLKQALKNAGFDSIWTGTMLQFPTSLTSFFGKFKERMIAKGYQMGGMPNSGELYMARENGTNEFIGSFGNKSVVANNDQIVTAVANGVSMANDSLRNAIEAQTNALEQAIDRKDLEVTIGDRQIAEANRRGQEGMGTTFVK